MGRVLTNNVGLLATIESAIGTLPGAPSWFAVEFDSLGAYGATITTVARRPISRDRGRKKGTVVDLDSAVEIDTDLTIEVLKRFGEGFMFSEFANAEFNLRTTGGVLPPPAVASGATFTIAAASAILGGKLVYNATGAISLLYAKGYLTAANNGLHVLAADVASTDTSVSVASTLVNETPPTNAVLEVAGVRVTDGDCTLTISGSTATLVSGGDVANWATLGLQVGQFIHFGSAAADGSVQNAFDDAGTDDNWGFARITAISSATLSLDKLSATLTATDTNTGVLDIMFGRFLRNVQVTADADDTRYLERTYQFEASYPGLGSGGATEYEYAIGNFVSSFAFNLPLTNKATVSVELIGTNSDAITASRKTGASSAVEPLETTAFNTSSDLASLSTDVVSSVSDTCFKSLTLTILNNVSPEKCLGTLGAVFVNAGVFEVNLEGQMAFTNKSIVNSIRSNTTVTFLAILRNEDGAVAIDMPELTLGGGGREFPVDQTVLVNITGQSYTSSTFGYDLGLSYFPSVPIAA